MQMAQSRLSYYLKILLDAPRFTKEMWSCYC
ncbi:hypothetical protein [Domibacillus tundrae]